MNTNMPGALCALVLQIAAACAVDYELVIPYTNDAEGIAYGINNHGYACGYSKVGTRAEPCIWTPDGWRYDLYSPSANDSRNGIAFAINDLFDVAGAFADSWSTGTYFYKVHYGMSTVWAYDPGMNDWDAYEIIDEISTMRDINDYGDTVGKYMGVGYVYNPWDESNFDSGWSSSEYVSVNEDGDATGEQSLQPIYAARNPDGSYTEIAATYIGGTRIRGYGSGVSVNIHDHVVGGLTEEGGFYWEPLTGNGQFFGSGTVCCGINDDGDIVGTYEYGTKACVWRKSGATYVRSDLDTNPNDDYQLQHAFDINENGQIVGKCLQISTGITMPFVLYPVVTEVQAKIDSVGQHSVTLSWKGVEGNFYRIQESSNLTTWESLPEVHEAYSSVSRTSRVVLKKGPKMYYKVVCLTP